MTNNSFLRSLRYAIKLSDSDMVTIFKLADHDVPLSQIMTFLLKEDDAGYVECSDSVLGFFLDGLIILKRGPKEPTPDQPAKISQPLTHNAKLKKLRIALELKEDAMFRILELGGVAISKPELTALFRNKDHKNYKECGDQFLRNFLKGLSLYRR